MLPGGKFTEVSVWRADRRNDFFFSIQIVRDSYYNKTVVEGDKDRVLNRVT